MFNRPDRFLRHYVVLVEVQANKIEKMKEKILEWLDDNNYGNGRVELQPLRDFVKSLNDGWIKVEDRLPEKERSYLVIANESIFLYYYGEDNKGRFVWWEDSEPIVKKHLLPTHWQPLPAPPAT